MIPNPPNTQCNHRDIYYSAEHDNFYCGHCHQGMGNQFYKLANAVRELIKFKPSEGSKQHHSAYDDVLQRMSKL